MFKKNQRAYIRFSDLNFKSLNKEAIYVIKWCKNKNLGDMPWCSSCFSRSKKINKSGHNHESGL